MPVSLAEYWVRWRSYNRATGGCCTHVTDHDSDTSLCGIETLDGAGLTLADTNGHIACHRCQKALAKLGIVPFPTSVN